MNRKNRILGLLFILLNGGLHQAAAQPLQVLFDFYGNKITITTDSSILHPFPHQISADLVSSFISGTDTSSVRKAADSLLAYKQLLQLDDWLFYQLIRKTAQYISPKADNYYRYTLYKWLFLTFSGYDAILTLSGDKLLFYVQSDEYIYNLPNRLKNGKQYVCLNYHDYGFVDFTANQFREVAAAPGFPIRKFSYRISNLPVFNPGNYLEKDIRFSYRQNDFYFRIKLNPEVKTLFQNYPVVDYSLQFNIPLSNTTYQSLVPYLKEAVKKKSIRKGVDFLMRFTRNAFVFETDSLAHGTEKRLSPEQTLLYDRSDCEDRAALFFYLVKEIYNLPMLVLVYPRHVTVAVKFEKPAGKKIMYQGNAYTVCEPTPQQKDLRIGQLAPGLENLPYEIAYVYTPGTY